MITSAKNKKKRLEKLVNEAIDCGGEAAQFFYPRFMTTQNIHEIATDTARRAIGYRGRYARHWIKIYVQGYEGMIDAIREYLVDHPKIRG